MRLGVIRGEVEPDGYAEGYVEVHNEYGSQVYYKYTLPLYRRKNYTQEENEAYSKLIVETFDPLVGSNVPLDDWAELLGKFDDRKLPVLQDRYDCDPVRNSDNKVCAIAVRLSKNHIRQVKAQQKAGAPTH